MSQPNESLRGHRRQQIVAYVVAWIAALLATNPNAALWSLVWMFPLGLVRIFYPPALRSGGWWVLLLPAALYVLHAVFYFRARTPRAAILLGVVLIALLTCNVAGCRSMINAR